MWWDKDNNVEYISKAVAYYRHSAQDRQENSIEIQREQVREFAHKNNIEIIKEFKDEGKSGLSTEGRDGFNEMIEKYVISGEVDFDYVLVLDTSRWGRFQDVDESGHYKLICNQHGKKVVYTDRGFPDENKKTLSSIQEFLDREMAAEYSRKLSEKVFLGCVKVVQQGFRAGGPAPYGYQRLLLDEQRRPVQFLKNREWKSIHNQRVTLAPGNSEEVAVVKTIFHSFVAYRREPKDIAFRLNKEGILSPKGKLWTSDKVLRILTNHLYIGTIVYNKTTKNIATISYDNKTQRSIRRTKRNPKDSWYFTENAFEGIIEKDLFENAQKILSDKKKQKIVKYSAQDMITKLNNLTKKYGLFSSNLIKSNKEMVSPSTYRKYFHSIDMAYQNIFMEVIDNVRNNVIEQIKSMSSEFEFYKDYILLDRSFCLSIQPAMPVACGYEVYWPFFIDSDIDVDFTLGALLPFDSKEEILGYVFLPRIMIKKPIVRIYSSNTENLDFYGYSKLDEIINIIR